MENMAAGFGRKMTGILAGSFSFAAIGAGISRAINQGDQLQDLANRFGVAASSIQEIGNAASLSGASVEDVASAMNKLARNAGEALAGNDKMAAAFEKIGLSTSALQGMSPQDLFMELSKAVASGSLGMSDFAVAQELAGRGAATLMETFRMGPEAIQANGQAMGVWSDQTIAALSKASDAIKTFQNKITIGLGGIIPLLNAGIERYQDFVEAVTLAFQARYNKDLDPAARADLMEQSSAKVADVIYGRSSVEQRATEITVRNTEARIEQYDREAAAKEAAASRWKRAMEDQMDLDAKEEVTAARMENRASIREAQRLRDATPGSNNFERLRAEAATDWNKAFNMPVSDAQVYASNPGLQAGLSDTAAAGGMKQTEGPKETTVLEIKREMEKAVNKLDELIRASGTFSM